MITVVLVIAAALVGAWTTLSAFATATFWLVAYPNNRSRCWELFLAIWVGVPLFFVVLAVDWLLHRHAEQVITDQQADHWANAAGLHPSSVWGWDAWTTAGLDPHRLCDLVPVARRIAAEITATGQPVRQTDLVARLRAATGETIPKDRAKALWAQLGVGRIGARGRPRRTPQPVTGAVA